VIAEIGVNHGGDLALAKRLIDLAKEGGADAARGAADIAEPMSRCPGGTYATDE